MYTLCRIISGPFKWCWRLLNFLREFILNVCLMILIIVITMIYLQIRHTPPIMTKGALIMDLTGTIVDKPVINNKFRELSRELLGSSSNRLQENSLFKIVNILRQAKTDEKITGLVLALKDFSGTDQTSLEYIGKALREFRDSGKPIYAVGDNYNQTQYYLTSYANKIYLAPYGVVYLHGMATNNFYYKTLLDKLKVNSHIFRIGTYKSAVEPLLRDNMSDAAREADGRVLDQIWQHYLTTVAANRKTTIKQFFPGAQGIIDGLRAVNGNTAQFALNNKWVDEIASRSEINEALVKVFGWNKQQKTFNGISIYDYQLNKPSLKGDQIAVIFANGTIMSGLEKPGIVGDDTTATQIRSARLDPNIKAIIFRVNSPGGSVTASEVIRSELAATRTAGKPIIISMGGMAASGGYWISTPANYIISSASTITGSIGIFSIYHTIENSLESIGIHNDGVFTSPLANHSNTKAMPKEVSQMMQMSIERSYLDFINLVAESRHKTPEEIDKIGQGHVWIGSDAMQNGLVDQLGDFDDAVNKAAELAHLKQHQLNWYEEELSLLDLLFTHTNESLYMLIPYIFQSWLPTPVVQMINKMVVDTSIELSWNDPQNNYAFCLSCEQIIH